MKSQKIKSGVNILYKLFPPRYKMTNFIKRWLSDVSSFQLFASGR